MELKVKDKVYTIRLTARNIAAFERRESVGLLNKIQSIDEGGSFLDILVKVLHAGLLFNHKNIKLEEVYDIYDDLVEHEGYDIEDFTKLLTDVLATGGLSKKPEKEKV